MFTTYITEWSYLAIFILAAIPLVELITVIPVGIILGLNPIVVGLVAFIGNWLTVLLLIIMFDRWQVWRAERKSRKKSEQIQSLDVINEEDLEGRQEGEIVQQETESKRHKRAHRIWKRFGLPGLALAGPFFIGTHLVAGVAMALKAPRQSVIGWMTLSLVLWTTLTAVVAYFGFEAFGFIQTDIYKGE